MNFLDVVNIGAGVGGVASVVGLVVYAARSRDEREDEERARVFYDQHGHWPDEEPGATTS